MEFSEGQGWGQTGAVSPYGSLEAGYKKAHTHANTHAHAQNTVSLESGDYVWYEAITLSVFRLI